MRFPDFLRAAVLLFAGSASALALVALVGAQADGETELVQLALGWWLLASLVGGWLGRRRELTDGLRRTMEGARASSSLPELEPGSLLFSRLWPLGALTIVAGALAFLVPQVPAIAAGFGLLAAFAWRRQAAAVAAVEGRDGVRFYVERGPAFGPPRLVRTPGFRRFEPTDPLVETGTGRTASS